MERAGGLCWALHLSSAFRSTQMLHVDASCALDIYVCKYIYFAYIIYICIYIILHIYVYEAGKENIVSMG